MNYKFQSFFIVCLLLAGTVRSYSQDSLKKEILLPIVKAFSENNSRVDSYKDLPDCIKNYLAQIPKVNFAFTKGRFNGTDMGSGPKRKLFYMVKNADNYIMSYAHGGMGRHFHSAIFMTNGKVVENVYNVISDDHKTVTELLEIIEKEWYRIRPNDEF